ncbi:YkgJ family cysteine cluster protein [Hahella sp. SMD15-11]|uniref:YkgJ family cysteine cluster protein n=1 Tax=Thermohahella caldifontis TaxID=3142973 RepID=A0AB39UZS2_9GAMM
MKCRIGCGACCIAPSISSPIPGMPEGKPAGIRCIHLDSSGKCSLFGLPERPKVCLDFDADPHVCGETTEDALINLTWLEQATQATDPLSAPPHRAPRSG